MDGDPYALLGVPHGAEFQVIRRAYRRLALRYHPDRNPAPDAAARFQAISAAYQSLRARGAPRPPSRHGVPASHFAEVLAPVLETIARHVGAGERRVHRGRDSVVIERGGVRITLKFRPA